MNRDEQIAAANRAAEKDVGVWLTGDARDYGHLFLIIATIPDKPDFVRIGIMSSSRLYVGGMNVRFRRIGGKQEVIAEVELNETGMVELDLRQVPYFSWRCRPEFLVPHKNRPNNRIVAFVLDLIKI